MNELMSKLQQSEKNVSFVTHRGVDIFYFQRLNLLDFGKAPTNGAAWVEFHQAAKQLGLIRTWADRNNASWTIR